MPGVPPINNDYLVLPITVNPSLDRRFPMLNGGGRTETGVYEGVTYRSPWCLHSWPAQQRTSTKQPRNRVFFGCRGYVANHELADDLDCGYLEEGVFNLGVTSVQMSNPAWGGVFIAPLSVPEWMDRERRLKRQPKAPWPVRDESIAMMSPTRSGSPTKASYAGQLGAQSTSPSSAGPSTSVTTPPRAQPSRVYRPAPASPSKDASAAGTTYLRHAGSNMSLNG